MADGPPFETNLVYCPHCDEDRFAGELEFLGLVSVLCNTPRFRFNTCCNAFETLPPNVLPLETNE
jgi:hypothetical protein